MLELRDQLRIEDQKSPFISVKLPIEGYDNCSHISVIEGFLSAVFNDLPI